MTHEGLFHEGELAVQKRAGLVQGARMAAGAILDRIPRGAMPFIGQQAMAVFGSADAGGNVWASLLFGAPGFLRAADDRTLVLRRYECFGAAGDPLWRNIGSDPRLGILLIELTSRRRLRISGNIRRRTDGDAVISVERAYANCPKYIQARHLNVPGNEAPLKLPPYREGRQLNAAQQAWIANADTFFVASAHLEQGMDASHRGGRPGFVGVLNPHRLRIPDYAGNNMFNTLGNFVSDPRAGLVFLDFERGRVLQLSGRTYLPWDTPDERGNTGGPPRYWELEIEFWRESELPFAPEWRFLDYSPFLPPIEGDEGSGDISLRLRIKQVWRETGRVKGFLLAAAGGGTLPSFEPGAHLPIMVRDNSGTWVERSYSLSSDPDDHMQYRIGVLAEPGGRGGSQYLHDVPRTGDIVRAGPPRNAFPLDIAAEHSILLAGGIGITPLLSMLHTLKAADRSFELHYTARHLADMAFRNDIERLAGERAHFYASREPGSTRLDLPRILGEPAPGWHVYVCGPHALIAAVRDLARTIGWLPDQIHFESFGAGASPDHRDLLVTLARSGRTVRVPATRSILDTLLDKGIAVPHDCRRGECSLCVTRVLDGEPEHRDLCLSPEERAESMCICVSRAKNGKLTLDR